MLIIMGKSEDEYFYLLKQDSGCMSIYLYFLILNILIFLNYIEFFIGDKVEEIFVNF